MPKSYEVEGTRYDFPDDFSDEKAASVLRSQGIIKTPTAEKQTISDYLPDVFRGNPKSEVFQGAVAGGLHTLNNLGQAVGLPSMPKALTTPPASPWGDVGNTGEQAAEFIAPVGAAGKAAKVSSVVGRYGPWASAGSQALAEGAASGAVGAAQSGGDLEATRNAAVLGAVMPTASNLVGRGLKWAAEAPMKVGLKLPWRSEVWGATPAKTALEETKGLTAGRTGESAAERVAQLNDELEASAAASDQTGSLEPARKVVRDEIKQSTRSNSSITPRRLSDLQSYLNTPVEGFSGATTGQHTPISFQQSPEIPMGTRNPFIPSGVSIVPGTPNPGVLAENQPALDLLGMRRQVNKDFISNWNPNINTKGELGTARGVYHEIGSEVDKAIPGGSSLDQRMSSLIPVANQGKLTEYMAGLGERALGRFGRHTGALAAMIGGGHAAGLTGAAAGLVLPEAVVSSMIPAARGMYGAGKAIQSFPGQAAFRATPLLTFDQNKDLIVNDPVPVVPRRQP